ncbi:outer membrane beta-barrel protein [uncultured Paraglaciecola sp.]|uniref:outer membrane beta-barrel protein n=1 Tax=uncultured Paraglaciecola sp. TaxID=1765024 RepID=UPI00259ABC7A|nr:outer membrane beta-barrel protein [uncultured Paraglaciecola sp.]
MKRLLLLLLGCVACWQGIAADRLYSVFSLGITNLEVANNSNQNLSYKLGLGYQFHPKWYVEAGYQQLGYDELFVATLPTANEVVNEKKLIQGDALFLAVLGKASNRYGELFYRLGLLKTDVRGQGLQAGIQECQLGQGTTIEIDNYGTATLCDYDEGGVAAVIGLGFDYFVGARTLVRTEIEYIKGQDDLEAASLFVGLRYNF